MTELTDEQKLQITEDIARACGWTPVKFLGFIECKEMGKKKSQIMEIDEFDNPKWVNDNSFNPLANWNDA